MTSINNELKNLNNEKTGEQPKVNVITIPIPTFEETEKGKHPKKFLKDVRKYMQHMNIAKKEILLLLENGLKDKVAKWFKMVKGVTSNIDTFQELFLKEFFSETKQWEIFISCTEVGKRPIGKGF